ncbi:MAG: CbiX/SirB N-terminal domain-containing protein, partial [Pseudomonadota bacterium]
YQDVSAAFLELAEPSIPDGILAALERGASEIVVLPYFLSAGRHVAEDIPGEVDKARRLRPEADVRIAPYLGSSEALVRLLADLADAG